MPCHADTTSLALSLIPSSLSHQAGELSGQQTLFADTKRKTIFFRYPKPMPGLHSMPERLKTARLKRERGRRISSMIQTEGFDERDGLHDDCPVMSDQYETRKALYRFTQLCIFF